MKLMFKTFGFAGIFFLFSLAGVCDMEMQAQLPVFSNGEFLSRLFLAMVLMGICYCGLKYCEAEDRKKKRKLQRQRAFRRVCAAARQKHTAEAAYYKAS